jgi:hypothetical protein
MRLSGNASPHSVTQGLCNVRLADTGLTDHQDRDLLVDVAASGQIVDVGAIELGQPVEVEGLQRLAQPKASAQQTRAELLLVAPCNLVMQQHGEELGIGELSVDSLAVTLLERVEHARQAQLLEDRIQFGTRIHDCQCRRME